MYISYQIFIDFSYFGQKYVIHTNFNYFLYFFHRIVINFCLNNFLQLLYSILASSVLRYYFFLVIFQLKINMMYKSFSTEDKHSTHTLSITQHKVGNILRMNYTHSFLSVMTGSQRPRSPQLSSPHSTLPIS